MVQRIDHKEKDGGMYILPECMHCEHQDQMTE